MRRGRATLPAILALVVGATPSACGQDPDTAAPDGPVELARFPLDSGDLPQGSAASFDYQVSQDGGGSLRVDATEEGLLRLYEVDDLGIVQGQVTLTGFLRSRGLRGHAMLELRCQPAEGDQAFIRGFRRAASGDMDWTPQEIRFMNPSLCRDPVSIQINLLLAGTGTVWVDNLGLWSVPVD